MKQLTRWESQVENSNRIQKLQKISEYVFEKFKNACEKCIAIHDSDLKK